MTYLIVIAPYNAHYVTTVAEVEALGFPLVGRSPHKDLPIFAGLIGPMDLHNGYVRYETQLAYDAFNR